MKISLETAFDIGDTVYAVELYHDYYTSHTPYIISDIIININNRDIRTMYCVERGDYTTRFPEEWLFSNYEDCAKWCKEHN